jgi:hypothetical protein
VCCPSSVRIPNWIPLDRRKWPLFKPVLTKNVETPVCRPKGRHNVRVSGEERVATVNVFLTVGFSHAITPITVISAVATIIQQSFDVQGQTHYHLALMN